MFVLLPAAVSASNETMLELFKLPQDKGNISASGYEFLKIAAVVDEKKMEDSVSEIKQDVNAKTKDLPKITLKDKYSIESQDGQHSLTPIGRIFLDAIRVNKNESTNVTSGSELRRARLGFEAMLFNNWKAKLEYDFADSSAVLKDGYISYDSSNDIGKYNVKVGQHHIPFGFATVSSSKYMSFLRRPLFADGPLQTARQLGVAFQLNEKSYRWNIIAGWFLDEPHERQTVAVRVTGIPFMTDTKHMLHIGASFMNSDPNGDDVRIRQRLLTHLDTSRLLDTGSLGTNVKDINSLDFELLGIYGPFYGLIEYVLTNVDDPNGDADFNAWSLEGGWFLTGESKKYDKAAFGSLSPKNDFGNGGMGAWELALRYENMDLNDGIYTGGDADVFTAGINWYPVKNIRFMADYSQVTDFNRISHPDDGKEPSALSFRTQVYW